MSGKKPTIDDVAALSKVGRTTVSRVLNGGPNVRDAVRERVLNAVEALNYKVNVQAKFLAGGGSRLLALIYASDLESEPNSFYASALEVGALRACTQLGFQLLTRNVIQHAPSRNQQILDLIGEQRCDGVVLTPPFSDDLELVNQVRARRCPVVCISPGRGARGAAPGVGMDDEAAGYEMARYLLGLRHRRLGFIHGIKGHQSADERYDGARRACRESGLPDGAFVSLRGDFTFKSGVELAPQMLTLSPRPTALICANDDMAAGALFAAHKLGVSVPDELSIVGFDDTPVSAIVWPPLTTVHQPIKAMGYRAVELLAEQLEGAGVTSAPRFEVLHHAVVVRQSAAAPALAERSLARSLLPQLG